MAMVAIDADATGEAVLQGDLDEARFRIRLLATKAGAMGLSELSAAAAVLCIELGPMGGSPTPGYGAGLLRVANELWTVIGCL
jgi:hypothetical protein